MFDTDAAAPLRRTKIVATLGPATDPPEVLHELLESGVDVVRLNLSHGQPEDHRRRAEAVRRVARELGREVAVLTDLQGPKIRIENFAGGDVEVARGDRFTLDCRDDAPPGDASRVGVSYGGLCRDVTPGDLLLLDDGLVSMRVEAVEGAEIHCRVVDGGTLSDRKGLNRKGGGLTVDALSAKDRDDIRFTAALEADFMAVSFVRSAADITRARALLQDAGSRAAIIAKIERSEAIPVLADIIDASDGVMVARGDLGVEIGYAELPGLQKKIIREALRRNRPVITATQMLQSMVESPIPTRAEVLDVANAVIDGTDAVMLSQETAAGAWPAKAVRAMRRICIGAEQQFEPKDAMTAEAHTLTRTDQGIAFAAMSLAGHLPVRAIVALTESGNTARWLSRYRSAVPIYALSPSAGARRYMQLLHDVHPIDFNARSKAPLDLADAALRRLHAAGRLEAGDRVILTHGDDIGRHGSTNTLKLLQVEADPPPAGTDEGLH